MRRQEIRDFKIDCRTYKRDWYQNNNFYKAINVRELCDDVNEIRIQGKKAMAKAHPDKGGTKEEFFYVKKASETLRDPELKMYYD